MSHSMVCVALESRQLLSTNATLTPNLIMAKQNLRVLPPVVPGPTGYTPQQIQNAYGLNQITFSGGKVVGNGAGQTIAIVTAYNDPNISSDLAAFDNQYGLSAPASFTVDNLGATTTDAGWAMETSLDVEWAHSVAPGASIILVEAPSASLSDLFNAVGFASNQPGVSVVSMSWGTTEFLGESAYDSFFTTPAGHTGVTFVAASGDSGAWYGPMYPSVSPNVLAVGGTTLTAAGGTYGSETGWSGSTGGFSGFDSQRWTYEPEPSYQTAALQAVGLNNGVRTTPDVSFNADPNTGVPVYDSISYSGQSGWFLVGGTSAATPAWAGLVAIADQGLATGGQGSLSGRQAQTDLYALPSSDFNDITTGFNGLYYATPGYDLVTGLGSPKANLVIADILAANGVSEGSATTQVTASAPTQQVVRATSSRFVVTLSSGSSSGSSSTAGLASTGLVGSTTSSSTFGMQALVTQVSSTQAQPVAQQATVMTSVNQSTAPSPSLGQSLPQQPQNASRSLAFDETTEPNLLIEDATGVPSPTTAEKAAPAPDQKAAPAPDQKAAPAPDQKPVDEAPALPQAPAPEEPVDDPATSLLDEALARISLSMAARRLEVPSGPTSEPEQATETLSDRSVATLAGAAALAVGGYRVLLGRSDRIKRRWMPGRFM